MSAGARRVLQPWSGFARYRVRVPRPAPGRVGLSAIWTQRVKSRASTRVTWFQGTSIAHRNRNRRSRSIPYDRCVAAERPARLQLPQIHRDRPDHGAGRVTQPVRLPHVAGLHQRAHPRHHQRREILAAIASVDHEPGPYPRPHLPVPRSARTVPVVQSTGEHPPTSRRPRRRRLGRVAHTRGPTRPDTPVLATRPALRRSQTRHDRTSHHPHRAEHSRRAGAVNNP
jgi:hypothetical protein